MARTKSFFAEIYEGICAGILYALATFWLVSSAGILSLLGDLMAIVGFLFSGLVAVSSLDKRWEWRRTGLGTPYKAREPAPRLLRMTCACWTALVLFCLWFCIILSK